MAPILRHLLLLSTVISSTYASPTYDARTSISNHRIPVQSITSKTLLQRLRDSIIERIWHIPKSIGCQSIDASQDQPAPSNLRTRYGADVVLRFKITTEGEAKAFSEAVDILYLDVWDYSHDWVDVRMAKDMLPSFLTLLPASLHAAHTPLMHDLAQVIHDTYPPQRTETWKLRSTPLNKQTGDIFFENYQPLSVLYPWLRLISSFFPHHVEYFSIGKSAEGRDIPAVKIAAPLREQEPDEDVSGRRAILIVGGTHAREWVSTSTVAYLIWQFATHYGRDHAYTVTNMLKHYDLIFVPVLNPDGYEYTWSNDRLWRKNRQATSLPFCPGIDLNRAFGIGWDGEDDKDNPCSESFAGEYAFQAVEAKALADWAHNHTRDKNVVISTYLDLHSYSQKVLYPYSHSCEAKPYNQEDLEELAIGIAKSFRLTTGRYYGVESACESQIAFAAEEHGKRAKSQVDKTNKNGGSSLDFFYDALRVKWSFQIKLRDQGTYGFLLPREYIIPTGSETFEAVVGLGRWLLSNRGIESVEGGENPAVRSSDEDFNSGKSLNEWADAPPQRIFRTGYDQTSSSLIGQQDDDEEEWERVYDAELKKR